MGVTRLIPGRATVPENAETPGVLKSPLCRGQEVDAKVCPTCVLLEFVPLFLPWPLSTSQAWWESVPCNRTIDLCRTDGP